jgi:hypothetical protein
MLSGLMRKFTDKGLDLKTSCLIYRKKSIRILSNFSDCILALGFLGSFQGTYLNKGY